MYTLEIVHRTRYEYSAPVTLGEHRLMFRPRDSHDLRLLHTGLTIEPAALVRWIHDPFGNSIALAQFEGTTQALELTSIYPHAWMEVYLPGAGWVEFDPTNGIIGTERLIRVAVARDPEQAMPIKGTFTGAADVAVNAVIDVQVRTLPDVQPRAAESVAEPERPPQAPVAVATTTGNDA